MFKREGAQSSDLVSVLPLRDLVVFPGMTVPLIVGRPASQAAVNRAWEGSQSIFLLTQRTGSASHPDHADLYDVGTVGRVLQRVALPDGNLKVLVEGGVRAQVVRLEKREEVLLAELDMVDDTTTADDASARTEIKQVQGGLRGLCEAEQGCAARNDGTRRSHHGSWRAGRPSRGPSTWVCDGRAPGTARRLDPMSRLESVLRHLRGENEILRVERKIKSRVKRQNDRNQKEVFLNDQMQVIQKEMSDRDEFKAEFVEPAGASVCQGHAGSGAGSRDARTAEASHDESNECRGQCAPKLCGLAAHPALEPRIGAEVRARICIACARRRPLWS